MEGIAGSGKVVYPNAKDSQGEGLMVLINSLQKVAYLKAKDSQGEGLMVLINSLQ